MARESHSDIPLREEPRGLRTSFELVNLIETLTPRNDINVQGGPRAAFRKLVGPAAVGASILVIATACGSSHSASPPTTTTTPTTTQTTPSVPVSPEQRRALRIYSALLKPPKSSTLPSGLEGAVTTSSKLSPGSRKHHAVGAVVTTNGGGLVGFLVFPTRADALADLKAFPPNSGPIKLAGKAPADFPKPSYLLSARGNGYTVRYVVFVQDNILVNSWAYGQKGKANVPQLIKFVEADARWARDRSAAVLSRTK
jgi:hypothetical protein